MVFRRGPRTPHLATKPQPLQFASQDGATSRGYREMKLPVTLIADAVVEVIACKHQGIDVGGMGSQIG
jgi:hypothetical protein